MSHWPYITASYVLTLGAMAVLVLGSWVAMRKAEGKAGSLTGKRISTSLDTGGIGETGGLTRPSAASEVEKRAP